MKGGTEKSGHIDVATERLGESARSKTRNAISVETVKAEFNRDEGDKGGWAGLRFEVWSWNP